MAIGGNTADSIATNAAAAANKFTLGANAATGAAGRAGATVLGPEATLRGDIKSKGDIVIAGVVEGEVVSEAKLVIAQGGSVTGRVSAVEVILEGRLVGDSTATKSLSILSSAEVRGDVLTPVITIEPGATFVGRCSMGESAK
jgi:cytoskeletal protein CcmA (bactofilin family)